MSDYSNIGELKLIPFEHIQVTSHSQESQFLINGAAQVLNKNGGRNWIPLIVKELDSQSFEVVGNLFIYTVVEAAGIDKVWCIVTDASSEAEEITKVLAKEIQPKINLSQATRDDIKSALNYLINLPGSPLKALNLATALEKIDASDRKYWEDFEPVTKLGCGITKGKKLDAFKEAFFLTPEDRELTPLPPEQERKSLKVTELRKFAKERKIPNAAKLTKAVLLKELQAFEQNN